MEDSSFSVRYANGEHPFMVLESRNSVRLSLSGMAAYACHSNFCTQFLCSRMWSRHVTLADNFNAKKLKMVKVKVAECRVYTA